MAEQPRLGDPVLSAQGARVHRGNVQEVHSQGVSIPSGLQVPPCLYIVQVLWLSCQGLLHVVDSSKEVHAL